MVAPNWIRDSVKTSIILVPDLTLYPNLPVAKHILCRQTKYRPGLPAQEARVLMIGRRQDAQYGHNDDDKDCQEKFRLDVELEPGGGFGILWVRLFITDAGFQAQEIYRADGNDDAEHNNLRQEPAAIRLLKEGGDRAAQVPTIDQPGDGQQ